MPRYSGWLQEELATVELKYQRKGDIIENQFRKEQHQGVIEMWTLLRIGAVFVLLSAGGASSAPPPAKDVMTPAGAHKFRKIKVGNAQGVVVPAAPDDKQSWTPDDESVRAFEEGLTAFLQKKKPSEEPNLHAKLDQYKRQYLGKVQRRRRILYVIFACRTAPDWEDAVRIMKDGGSCYFQINYNPAKRTYSELYINHPS